MAVVQISSPHHLELPHLLFLEQDDTADFLDHPNPVNQAVNPEIAPVKAVYQETVPCLVIAAEW